MSTYESRGMEMADALPPSPGTCTTMSVSVFRKWSSGPACSEASTSGGSGLPCTSVRLSMPTSRKLTSWPSWCWMVAGWAGGVWCSITLSVVMCAWAWLSRLQP